MPTSVFWLSCPQIKTSTRELPFQGVNPSKKIKRTVAPDEVKPRKLHLKLRHQLCCGSTNKFQLSKGIQKSVSHLNSPFKPQAVMQLHRCFQKGLLWNFLFWAFSLFQSRGRGQQPFLWARMPTPFMQNLLNNSQTQGNQISLMISETTFTLLAK